MITVEVTEALQQHPHIKQLAKDFKEYKSGGNPGRIFGRDEPYMYPESVWPHNLRHVHILKRSDPCYKKTNQYARTSDYILVYTCGKADPNAYYLIAILNPDGHEKQRDLNYIGFLGGLAEDFRRDT